MSNMDENRAQGWYSPMPEARQEQKSKKPRKKLWIALGLLLLLALIAGSSLLFSGNEPEYPSNYMPGEKLPGDWKDFFDNYYTEVERETIETNIPRLELGEKFELELKQETDTELSLQQLYADHADTIVAITSYVDGESGYYWGTGVIVRSDGLIVTNAHVIEGSDRAEVTLFDDRSFEAKLVGADSISDLALLKIEATGLHAADFADMGTVQVGDPVAAIGNPLGEEFRSTMTNGIVSAMDRGISYNGRTMSLIQTNTAINGGNSGGALFNMHGQVIGITNMKMTGVLSNVEGMGFAIPSTTVKTVIESLAEHGQVRGRTSIGITVGAVPEAAGKHYELPAGLYISAVSKGSDAEAQGVQVGDILTAIDGVPVTSTQDVLDAKNALSVGDSMSLSLWREGEELEISVKLVDTNDIY